MSEHVGVLLFGLFLIGLVVLFVALSSGSRVAHAIVFKPIAWLILGACTLCLAAFAVPIAVFRDADRELGRQLARTRTRGEG